MIGKQILSDLDLNELNETRLILSKWSIKRDSEIGKVVARVVNCDETSGKYKEFFKLCTRDIIEAVEKRLPWLYNHPKLKYESLAGACVAFFGLIVYRIMINFPRREGRMDEDKELDINLVLLYLGADFLLDDSEVDESTKRELVRCIDKGEKRSNDERVQSVLDIMYRLFEDEPLSRDGIMDAWESEKRAERQKRSIESCEDPFEVLWDISGDKGYKTVLMANKIINSGQDLPQSKIVGNVTQHVDDLVDHATDKAASINTAVTILMKEGKCLDKYLYRVLREISEMTEIPLLGIAYVQIVCNCGANNSYTSAEMRRLLGDFLIFSRYRQFEKFIEYLSN